jgi:hypothetical protein
VGLTVTSTPPAALVVVVVVTADKVICQVRRGQRAELTAAGVVVELLNIIDQQLHTKLIVLVALAV